MNFAFCILRYFPFGGLQRDFLKMAQTCLQRGHQVSVFTHTWEGSLAADFPVQLIPIQARQNHNKIKEYIQKVTPQLAPFDCVVGFNKMPNLDVYFAGDVCYQTKAREKHYFWYRWTPRYRQLVDFESAVFKKGNKTRILSISDQQAQEYIHCYGTEKERFYSLPPGIQRGSIAPLNAAAIRAQVRQRHHLTENDLLTLMVGSGFKTKGLDRILHGLASLPEALKKRTHLYVIGQDQAHGFLKLAQHLKFETVQFLGGRNDVPDFLLAADALLHPAYHENTGTVLLEALAAGLPVLTTDVCGYAHYLQAAQAGEVLPSPFVQETFNAALKWMLNSPEKRMQWKENGIQFAHSADIFSMHACAVDYLERFVG